MAGKLEVFPNIFKGLRPGLVPSAATAGTRTFLCSDGTFTTPLWDTKESCRATSSTNITLSGTQTVDGVALIAGDRILVTGQTSAPTNGIYVVASGAWARSTDANTSALVTSGMFTFIEEGTTFGGNGFILTTHNPIVLGTTALTFTQFSGAGEITAGLNLTKTGNTLATLSALTSITSITSTASTDLTLNAGSGNQNVNLTPSGSGQVIVSGAKNGALVQINNNSQNGGIQFSRTGTGAGNSLWQVTTGGGAQITADANLSLGSTSANNVFTIQSGGATNNTLYLANGRALIGTTTDNSNGILQLASSTSGTAGIAWGSDANLYRAAASTLRSDGSLQLGNAISVSGQATFFTNTIGGGTNATAFQIVPTYNQTGTASGTDLLVNRTQTAVGSGAQKLLDLQEGGVSDFFVNAAIGGRNGVNSFFLQAKGNSSGATFGCGDNWLLSAPNGGTITVDTVGGSAGATLQVNGPFLAVGKTNTSTSGTFAAASITPTYNQASGTAANTDLLINRTQTAVGSGTQRLIDAQIGGSSKFSVDNTGALTSAGTIISGGNIETNFGFTSQNGANGMTVASTSTVFKSNSFTALTLDSSQNATFAGTISSAALADLTLIANGTSNNVVASIGTSSGQFQVKNGASAKFLVDQSGNLTWAGTMTDGGTTNGTAAWKHGPARTGTAFVVSTTTGIQVNIGGTTYTLAVLTTNP